jgi:hypothetical protein
VGFSGGTGGANALQTISNFTYSADTTLPAVQTTPQVNLTGYYNSYGIQNDPSGGVNNPVIGTGNPAGLPGGGTTGYDGGGNQLSNTFFGPSQTVTDNGTTQTFNFGPVNTPGSADEITAQGQTINLPQGQYGNLSFLGSAVNGGQQNQVFTVNYTDGTSQSFTQSLSDWWAPATTYPGETVAISMPYHLDNTGAEQVQGANQNININEYQFALNPAKTAASITLPINENVKILAINVNAAPVVTAVSPNTGPAAGGTVVTITGTGFTGETAVDFGSTPATNVTVNSTGTQITATDPAGTNGSTVDVTVVGPYGTSATTSLDKFTYGSVSNPVSVTSVVVNGNNSALAGIQRSMVNGIVYTFNQAVKLGANAFTLAVHSGQTGTLPTLTYTAINPDASGASTQWLVSFSGAGVTGGSIGDGVYDITLNSAAVSSEAAPTATVTPRATDTFYRMYGDALGTGKVNSSDYNAFLSTFGLKNTAPGYLAYFADDGTTKIDSSDYNAFLGNFGKKLSGFTATI